MNWGVAEADTAPVRASDDPKWTRGWTAERYGNRLTIISGAKQRQHGIEQIH
jgi:hypothetical protein